MLLALAAIGAATNKPTPRAPNTFGGTASVAEVGRLLLRASTMAAEGRFGRNNPSTPFLGADADDVDCERCDHRRPTHTDVEVEHFADEAMRDEEQMKKTSCLCRFFMKMLDTAGNFFADLPPVDEPLSGIMKKCGAKRLSNFIQFSKPGSRFIYGMRQSFMVVGFFHTAAHAIDKAGHPEWVATCMANDSYFHWISDPSKRHVCSVGIDVAPIATFLFFAFKSAHENRGRYILPLFGCCGDWPADRQYRHFISDERKAIRQEVRRRKELCFVDNTTLRINKLNDPLALMSVVLNAELDHAETVIAEATESANLLAIQAKRARDQHINDYVTENYKPKQPALFAAITDAAIAELPSLGAHVDGATPAMGATATMDRDALRKRLTAVDQHMKARQRSFQEETRETGILQPRRQRSLQPARASA